MLVQNNSSLLAFFLITSLIKIVVISFLFCLKSSSQKGIKKRTKETPRSPLFTGGTARFARAYARRKNVLLDARCALCVCVC